MAFPNQTVIANGASGGVIRAELNRRLATQDYFDFAYFDATASQSIPSGVWTTVDFDALFNQNTDVVLNANGTMTFPPTIGGYWDIGFYVAWQNNHAGLGKHRRLCRYMADGFQVVQGTELLFDPAMGDLGKPSYQFGYVQAGLSMSVAQTHSIQVYHNAGMNINIVKSGIDAPLFMFARRGDWEAP